METATFAAGCFWGVEAIFQDLPGVISTRVGYTGGDHPSPNYELVCTDTTNHAEAVEVIFDENQISYTDLLNLFWDNHNPTTLNRQGVDVGRQYRSVIFYHTPQQQQIAIMSKKQLAASGKWADPIVTQIVAASEFYPAEDYHQKYLHKRNLASCNLG
jgi:peptide-methionine (S)-S-oxide reductase